MYMDDEVVGQIVYNDDGISTVTFDVGDGTVFTLTTGAIYAKATDVCYKYPVGSEDIEIQVSLNNVDVTDNFDLAFTPGTLTINPRLVIITANDNPNEVYDGKAYEPNASMEEEEQEPELPYTVSADPDIADSGLVADHTVNATIEVWTEPETEDGQSVKLEDGAINAGTYKLKINAGNVKITSADNVDVTANYVIQLDDGTLTINRRPVTISVITPRAKVYDGKAYDPNASIEEGQEEQESKLPFTVSADPDIADSGLVEDHTVDAYIEVFPESETEGEQGETTEAINAGTYTLRINNDENGENKVKITSADNVDVTRNYAINLEKGELTINPRPVYVYAIGSKSFGTVDPVDDEGNLVCEIKDNVAQNNAQNAGMVDTLR